MNDKKEKMIRHIAQERGFVLDFHKVLSEQDPDFLNCYEAMVKAAYSSERSLDKKVREFLFIAALTALRAE